MQQEHHQCLRRGTASVSCRLKPHTWKPGAEAEAESYKYYSSLWWFFSRMFVYWYIDSHASENSLPVQWQLFLNLWSLWRFLSMAISSPYPANNSNLILRPNCTFSLVGWMKNQQQFWQWITVSFHFKLNIFGFLNCFSNKINKLNNVGDLTFFTD